MSVATENILSGKNDLLVGDPNVDREADDAWERHRQRHGVQEPSIGGFDQLSFPKKQKDNSLFDVAYAQGLVVVIQYEHFPVHFTVGTYCEFCCGEV